MLWTPILKFVCWRYRTWFADIVSILMVLRRGWSFETAKTVLLKDARMKVDIYTCLRLDPNESVHIASSAIPDRMTNPLKLRPTIINTETLYIRTYQADAVGGT